GSVFTGYTGTVTFTSSDAGATLPASYTFTAGDAGTHTFPGVTLVTAGSHTLTVADTDMPTLTRTVTVSVTPGAADHFTLSMPVWATPGPPSDVPVTARDPSGNVVTGFLGTVAFLSSAPAPGVMIPAEYTFTAGDAGVHTFSGFVLVSLGD